MRRCPNCDTNNLEIGMRQHRNGSRNFFVTCNRCYMRGPWAKTWEGAQEAWDKLPRRKSAE